MAKLFLESVFPELKKQYDKCQWTTCTGCLTMQPNQLAHECMMLYKDDDEFGFNLYDPEHERYKMVAPLMVNKAGKIFQRMRETVEQNRADYKDISLEDFLEFYGPMMQPDPFTRLTSDNDWVCQMKEKLKAADQAAAAATPNPYSQQ
jgi:hypothetical protein